MAIAVGIIIISLLPSFDKSFSIRSTDVAVLSVPLVLSFFLLIGIWGNINIPVSLQANWIFHLTEHPSQKHYYYGLKKGIFFFNLLPIYAGFYLLHLFLWDGLSAFYHCAYGLTISVLMMEILLLRYTKIPFACSYLPGKEKLQLYWLLYLVIFLVYVSLFPWLEKLLLRTPRYFIVFYGIVLFIIIGFRIYQNYFFYRKQGIKYEEMPEPALTILKA
jgi:hypothetical protein